MADTLAAATRDLITRELDRAGIPGCAMGWAWRDGSEGTLEHGVADVTTGRPVEPTTAFHLFSGTKLYTAAALMRLVERGAVRLDEPVRRYLPELGVRETLTVRHLASHASGLGDTLKAFLAVHFADEPAPSTGQALARYRLGRGGEPGRSARYANVNYAILGELVSRVAGVPFERFVESELLVPLGAPLGFEDRGAPNAVGHVPRFSPMLLLLRFLVPDVATRIRAGSAKGMVALRPYSLDTAAIGGLVGTASAFLPFLREMLSDADGVLRAESKHQMLTLHARGAAGIVSRDGVGLGWKRGTVEGRTFWNHEGGGAGFGTETRLYPDVGLGIVLLGNVSHSAGLSRTFHRIAERVRATRG